MILQAVKRTADDNLSDSHYMRTVTAKLPDWFSYR